MMNKRICKRLFLIGMALSLVLAGCVDPGGEVAKSNEAKITALILTIGGVDNTITFGTDGTANVALSESVTSTMPTYATVKSVTLSAGASGLVKDQKLTLTEGSVTVTITAEDGTTKKEYTVTVTIGDKLNLNTVALSYADVETTAGTANDTGVDPQWVGSPTPEGITYSITNYAPPGGGNGVDGSDGDSPAVAIDADGKITITDAAEAENSGTYTVTATAGASSNYEANATQTATVTVTIAKRNLGTVTLTYPVSTIKAVENFPNAIGIEPAWDTGNTGGPTPSGITYSIDASATNAPTTDGTEGTPVVAIDESTGKITITVAAEADNSGDYTVTATAGESSNYLKDSTQTFDVTVEITATKASLDTTSFTYTGVETTAGTANDIGVAPVWDANSVPPSGIAYSLTASTANGPTTDGSGDTVVIDTGTGKITITDGAEADNSGEYTVTATAGTTSSYLESSTQTAIVTVTIAKRNLNTATFSYTVKKALGAPYDGFFKPVWTLATGAPTPEGITYSITAATGASEPNTDGTAGGTPVVDIDPNTGEITITAAAVEANSGDYTVEATANQNSSYLNGSKQTTTATVKVIVYNVGDDGPAGGKVFYDEGDYTKGWRYLEAAPSDHGSVVEWGGDGDINGGTQADIGSGKDNTANIVATLVDNEGTNYAAKICNELDEGGFTDWFLPSKDELDKLYERKVAEDGSTFSSSFSSAYYWSSTVDNISNAWTQFFGYGNQHDDSRGNVHRVRAVRAF